MSWTPVKIDKIILPSGEIDAVDNARISGGMEMLLQNPSGHLHPMAAVQLRQRPVIAFDTPEIETILADAGVVGAAVANCVVYLKAGTATGSTARASLAHTKLTIAAGLLTWSQIQLSHAQAGSVSCELRPYYDETNEPIVVAGSQALLTTLAAVATYGLGPVLLNNSEIVGCQSVTIQNQQTFIQDGHKSFLWDSFVGVENLQTSVQVTTRKGAVNWSTLGLDGVALDGSNGIEVYARRLRSAADASNHIYFQGLSGLAYPDESSAGQRTGLVEDRFRVDLVASSDSVVPLVGTTGADITPEIA